MSVSEKQTSNSQASQFHVDGTKQEQDPESQRNPITGPDEEAQDASDRPGSSEEQDEVSRLAALGAGVRDQDDLERNIGQQAEQLLLEQANERDQKRLEKTQKDEKMLEIQVEDLEARLAGLGSCATKEKQRGELEHCKAQLEAVNQDLQQIQNRMEERQNDQISAAQSSGEAGGNRRMPGESRHDFLLRTGRITPFSKIGRPTLKPSHRLGDVLLDAETQPDELQDVEEENDQGASADTGPVSHRNLLAPGFEVPSVSEASPATDVDGDAELAKRLQEEEYSSQGPSKRRRLHRKTPGRSSLQARDSTPDGPHESMPQKRDDLTAELSHDVTESDDTDDDVPLGTTPGVVAKKSKKKRGEHPVQSNEDHEDLTGIDDGNETLYQARLQSWVERRSTARQTFKQRQEATSANDDDKETEQDGSGEEWHKPHPSRTDAVFEDGFKIPGDIYPSLFGYQKTGVQWLWELYTQQVGGIIGDEMGLGKTIQVISFLAGLHYSSKLEKPIIVVCPATVMKQWVNEFHRWWPPFRVSILHSSGSGMLNVKREVRVEDELEHTDSHRRGTLSRGHKGARGIVDRVMRDGHVLVTTYSGLQSYAELLIPIDWGYAVLDEGHKIRNPNTAITIFCKELRTHNRVILSGTPMQNNLQELWSLFDFVYPMRLGTLVTFRDQFEIPIRHGNYANASNLELETAIKCAETLSAAIRPYLLQRFKVDVAADLPKKSERVLFCKLTKQQKDVYSWFLKSEEMQSIRDGKRNLLFGVDILRKICNHPDLADHKVLSRKPGYTYGSGFKSGKMQVVKELLSIWKKQGHKTLLFAQHRITLDVLENFIRGIGGFNHRRMDGTTNIKDRQNLVDEFNRDPDLHVFFLTTKVGGLGINLTGANRVIIYDPDWNPSTDVQARERAWRLGQKREVEIYRLMTAGTIEEKIYHRQIFKSFLANKILRDPKQRQTFQLKDLHDLFSLGDSVDGQTETGALFQGTEVQLSDGKKETQMGGDGQTADGTSPAPVDEIVGVARQEDYRGNADEKETSSASHGDGGAAATNNEDRILSSIFARSGVQSAHEHDAIINGPRTARADPEMIAREARRVASEAAKELQLASTIARTIPAGQPTWTGQVGESGRPQEPSPRRGVAGRGRGGTPSPVVLASLQNLRGGGTASASASRARVPSMSRRRAQEEEQPTGREFLALIRDFLVSHGGSAYTQMLIDHFNRFCGSEQRTAEFKEMLRTIATMERGGRGRAKWVLKGEYRPAAQV